MAPVFGMFVKQPKPGLVKTRLAATLGALPAANLYRAFLADLIGRFRDFPGRRILAITPNDSEAIAEFRQLAAKDFELWPQPNGSLGDRLTSFFDEFRISPAVVIGSDSPTLPKSLVEEAVHQLDRADIVLGPANDGGVYLIGLRAGTVAANAVAPRVLFDRIEWSTSQVCQQLGERAATINASLSLLPAWYDVDEPPDIKRVAYDLGLLSYAEESANATAIAENPATRQALSGLKLCP